VGAEQEALGHLQAVLVRLDAGLARARYGAWLGAVANIPSTTSAR
jgi:DNA mismatch repair protein MutS2